MDSAYKQPECLCALEHCVSISIERETLDPQKDGEGVLGGRGGCMDSK